MPEYLVTASSGRKYRVHADNDQSAQHVEQWINARVKAGDHELSDTSGAPGKTTVTPRKKIDAPKTVQAGRFTYQAGSDGQPKTMHVGGHAYRVLANGKPDFFRASEPDAQSVIMQGMTLGGSDEAAGVVNGAMEGTGNALSDLWNGKGLGAAGSEFGKAYTLGKDRELSRVEATRAAHPWPSFGGEMLGGLLTGGTEAKAAEGLANAPKLLKTMLRGAKTGAKQGTAAGFLYNDGNLNERLGSGLLGAGLGGGLGVLLPPVAEYANKFMVQPAKAAIGAGGKYFNDWYNGNVAASARQLVAKSLASDNIQPREALEAIRAARQNGVPLGIMDQGANTRGLTASVSRKPGVSRRVVTDVVTERQGGQNERVRDAITRDLGPIANVPEQSEALINQAKAAAAPLYEKAYQAPSVGTPEIESLLATPFGRSALGRARTIAANERRDPAALGFALDHDGAAVLNPVPVAEHGAYAAARAEYDSAQEAVARAGASLTREGMPAAQRRLADAAAKLESANQTLSAMPSADSAAVAKGYTTQTLDYVKRGMDDVLEQYRNPITGKLVLDEAGRAQNGVKNQLLSEVDRLNPDYGAARKAFQGPARERDALELGQKAITATGDDIERMTANMSDGEKQQFALGFRSAMSEALDRKTDAADKVGTLLGTPRKREALAAAQPGANLGRFGDTLTAEKAANETFRKVTAGSDTARSLADDATTTDGALGLAGRIAAGGVKGGKLGAAKEMFAGVPEAFKFGIGQTGDRVREQAATLLSQSDPAVLGDLLRQGLRAQAERRAFEASLRRGTVRTGGLFARGAGAVTGYATTPEDR